MEENILAKKNLDFTAVVSDYTQVWFTSSTTLAGDEGHVDESDESFLHAGCGLPQYSDMYYSKRVTSPVDRGRIRRF